jgi:hypothetical protein
VIPPFDTELGEDGRLQLPPGIHVATWQELEARFGINARRREILDGLLRALQALKAAGCTQVYVDGSFVTSKELPGDFDGCWDDAGVDYDRLDPVLLEFKNHRAAQKAKFDGEMFVASTGADPMGTLFLDFFQRDRDGRAKGIVQIDLESIPS